MISMIQLPESAPYHIRSYATLRGLIRLHMRLFPGVGSAYDAIIKPIRPMTRHTQEVEWDLYLVPILTFRDPIYITISLFNPR
jgi:hypothetical protein